MKLVLLILAASASFAWGQSCTAPDAGNGTCVPIHNCHTLAALVTKANRTQDDIDLLKKAACGFHGTTPKVCCQQSCYTPEGLQGNCIDIHECPHLASNIKRPLSKDVIAHLRKSRCKGTTHYSVCCGSNVSKLDQSYCKNQVFINPPDSNSECCGIDLDDDKIIDGPEARMLEYPWLALIEYEKDGKSMLFCGGVLISSKYVLTAAHCLVGPILESGTPKNVRLGEYDTSNDGKDCTKDFAGFVECTDDPINIPIERAIVHPDYNTLNRWNDIALIRMKENAPFTDFIRPICLPATDLTSNPPKFFRLTAAGWGAVNETLRKSAIKLHATLPLVDKQQCQAAFSKPGRRVTLWDKQVCAGGERDRDSCKGDSGGPLMYKNYETRKFELIGLVSFGVKPCGMENVPRVYTKVFEYKNWIHNTITLWN